MSSLGWGWAVVGQRMVVVRIVILSARTWQDVVDLNFLRTGNQRTCGEIHTRAGGSAHRPRVCSAGIGNESLALSLLSDLGRSSRLSEPQSSTCKMGMVKGPCKDTLRNSNIYKTSLSLRRYKILSQ